MIEEARFVPYQCEDVHAGDVLVIAPHADDEVIGCGGAILKHRAAGHHVRVVVVTDDAVNPEKRQQECLQAVNALGCATPPEFLAFPDRGLRHRRGDLVARLLDLIEASIRSVYLPSPWEAHPDHFDTCLCALAAVQRSGQSVAVHCYEVSIPLAANVLVDVTDELPVIERALAHYHTQLSERDYTHHLRALRALRAYTLPPAVRHAEAYQVVASTDAKTVEALFGHTRRDESLHILE